MSLPSNNQASRHQTKHVISKIGLVCDLIHIAELYAPQKATIGSERKNCLVRELFAATEIDTL